ncbi:MAG: DNA internalization-related competence protein ComEC/Rec2 [Candidatus Cloacimonetes bacterium]|nr:DNA internalization-related competence protein ComEC/Rec2 [Candidatus Cloacimonadota bacterium]MCF7814296.1 DNA internalization-related competence protein ComEC/Rec2 [Candidatus Cloacimonadota bacterium]MCF7868875.1 DNA internalization-related competence protein ComEC/Rec2 [Candidatus Cloacimonadota bacterium]MCF7884337.1 DNA internalization-related competence protein ComEC/Rec2 [Candidatus Cloacimonadota bacterium]
MKQKLTKSPLFLPLIFWCAGIIIGNYFNIPHIFIYAGFILILSLAFIKKVRTPALFVLILLTGISRIDFQKRLLQNPFSEIMQKHSRIQQKITGRIISEVSEKDQRFKFLMELESINNKQISGRIRLSTSKQDLQYGDIIETIAVLHKIQKGSNPSVFDAEKYFYRQNIQAVGFTKDNPKIISNDASIFQKTIINIRKFIVHRIEKRFPANSGFIKAITIGDKSELDDMRKLLGRAGLSHLLAVSGLHVGLIALILFSFLKLIFKRNFARFLLIITLIVYGFICYWPASVFRAVIMISLFLLSKIIQRKADTNNILFCSLIVITAVHPYQLFSAGLQMSFMAVFVLLNLLPHIKLLKLEKQDIFLLSKTKKLINYVLIMCFSSFFLNLFLAPITIYHFQQFGFNGILGNLLGIPIMGIILPISLLIIFLPPISWLISVYHSAFSFIMFLFNFWSHFAAQPPLHFDFISVDLEQAAFLYLLLFSGFLFFSIKKIKRKLIFLFSFVSVLIVFILTFPSSSNYNKITFFDCGLGDLALIQTSEGKNIMIDTGPTERTSLSFGRSALPYCQNNGIKTIDKLFVTHAHNDHYGGLESVLENLEVKSLVITDEFTGRKVWQRYQDEIDQEKCEIILITDTISFFYDDLTLEILHPDKDFHHENINNNSIVILADFGEFEVMFTGDLELEGEEYILQRYADFLPAEILKVGHHGSKTASSLEFVDHVHPQFAFISTSIQNRFDFPHSQTLSTFSYLEDKLFISGKDGAVQLLIDEDMVFIKSFLSEKKYSIKIE